MMKMTIVALIICMGILHLCDAHNTGPGNTPEDIVSAHSSIRKALGMPLLTWDEKVASVAQAWADQRKDCTLTHSQGSGYGENMAYGHELNTSFAVQMWIDERRDYDYATNHCLKMCGHYTQVIWRDSLRVGCGRTRCDITEYPAYLVVCNYDPPGNYIDNRPF